jgi:copper(I)-binding protein
LINTLVKSLILPVILGACPAMAEIIVQEAYVRGLPPGVTNTAAYMTLRNTGDVPLALTGAATDIAGMTMLHRTVARDGMMHMEHVEAIEIPAQGELKLESGGLHLMLMNLKSTPMPGTAVALTLAFADGTTVAVSAPVRSVLDE